MRRGRRERRVELVDASVDGVTARVVALQLELERLEDRVAAAGWAWDAACSRRVDALHIYIEATRA